MKLAEAREDEVLRITRIEADSGAKRILYELGLTPGREVRVLFNDGVVVVYVGSSKLCLAKSLAEKVLVEKT